MSPIVPGAGVDLAADLAGDGPPVLLVHDMADTPADPREVLERLGAPARVIAYARRGYGASGAPEPYSGTTVAEQAEDAAALLAALEATGVVALGEGFGALVVLDLLLRHHGLVRAAVLADPPLFAFAPEATRELAEERGDIQEAVAAHGPEAGVQRWLATRPGRDAARASADHRAFFADYAGLATLPLTRAQLRGTAEPVVVLTGPGTSAAVRLAADAAGALLPAARRRHDGDAVGALASLL